MNAKANYVRSRLSLHSPQVIPHDAVLHNLSFDGFLLNFEVK